MRDLWKNAKVMSKPPALDLPSAEPIEEWVKVTPDIAAEWLKHNRDNRRLVTERVLRFAQDMDAGRWPDYHPHGIAFDDDGRLIDGQHRLEAVALSGATVVMRVSQGLDPRMHSVFDLGAPRSASDVLLRGGVQNSAHAGTLISMLYLYDKYPDSAWHNPRYPSKTWQLQYAMAHQDEVQDAVRESAAAFRHTRIARTQYGVLYMLVARHGLLDEWAGWHDGIMSGSGLLIGDPRLTLRNYFMHDSRSREGSTVWNRQRRLAIVLKAYRAYREGRSVRLLRFDRNSLPMPTIIDGSAAQNAS